MLLDQDQSFQAQEWPFEPGARSVRMWVEEPPQGIQANTGLMLVLHNWGGVYNSPNYVAWCRSFASRYNVVAASVNYLQSGDPGVAPRSGPPYDFGYLQAMDAIGALYHMRRQLLDKVVPFNERRIYAMGGSGGGNVTQMALKLAPRTFACGVDICGMPGLPDSIADGENYGGRLTAGYSRDPRSPNYLSRDMQEIRDFGHPGHCRLLHEANPGLKIVIVHGVHDQPCPVGLKIAQFRNMVEAGLDVDGHFLTAFDVDGEAVTSTAHSVGNRDKVVMKYADVYLKEDDRLARQTAGPSDFSRGGQVAYPTTNGRYVVDYSAYPAIRFEPA